MNLSIQAGQPSLIGKPLAVAVAGWVWALEIYFMQVGWVIQVVWSISFPQVGGRATPRERVTVRHPSWLPAF